MAKSDISICNAALSALGQRSILSFDSTSYGDNALLCKNIYKIGHEFVLSKADWPFARSRAVLNKIAEPETDMDEGYAMYSLPNLCLRPLSLRPPYHTSKWELMAEGIMAPDAGTDLTAFPRLLFTKNITDPTKFSPAFTQLLISYLVAKLAGPIAGLNPKESAYYNSIFMSEIDILAAPDLNIGQGSHGEDRAADTDTFNQP